MGATKKNGQKKNKRKDRAQKKKNKNDKLRRAMEQQTYHLVAFHCRMDHLPFRSFAFRPPQKQRKGRGRGTGSASVKLSKLSEMEILQFLDIHTETDLIDLVASLDAYTTESVQPTDESSEDGEDGEDPVMIVDPATPVPSVKRRRLSPNCNAPPPKRHALRTANVRRRPLRYG